MRFIIVLLVFIKCIHAQTGSTGDSNVEIFIDGESNLSMMMIKNQPSINNTLEKTYLFKEWVDGAKLYTKGKKEYTIRGLNYNISNNVFEIKISKDSVYILDSNYIDSIRYKESIFIRNDSDDKFKGFYEVLFTGKKISLFKKHKLKLIRSKTNPLDGTVEPNKYYLYGQYYVFSNQNLKKIKLKKKVVLSLLLSKSKEVQKFVLNNKISYKKESDVIKILEFYDSLL